MTFNVLIPTLNEATHIAEAVRTSRLLGDVFVLDSHSRDGTQQLAADAGATVVEHTFENYSKQKNWALDNLPWTGEWIFILDADERITPALQAEIERRVCADTDIDGYYVNRKLLIFGQQVSHGGLFPSWNLRLFRRGRARYEDRSVHEHMICDGPSAYLDEAMLHIRLESMTEYLAKHVKYAELESDEWVKLKLGTSREASADKLFRRHLRLRQWLRRHAWRHTPCRPFIRLMYMYVLKLGFLDGAAGWRLAWLMANYEYMISTLYQDKLYAARRPPDEAARRHLQPPTPAHETTPV